MNRKHANGRILPCPGLKVTTNAGISFTDSLKRVHDLEREEILRPKEAATDIRLGGMPVAEVLRAIRQGELYPVFRRNARVILIFDCALTDWRARQLIALSKLSASNGLTTQPLRLAALSPSNGRHLAQTQGKVA